MHLPTLARYAGKSLRYPSRAVKNGIAQCKFAMFFDPNVEREKLFAFLADNFHVDTDRIHQEFITSEFPDWMSSRREELANFPGPYRFASTGQWECEALYYLVRALEPRTVVETGVAYGASTSYILEALSHNGGGHLYSIDLGNTPDEPPNDFFLRPGHQDRWTLIIGDSKNELPTLLDKLVEIDHFHHDSLHTHEHMTWEYKTARDYICSGGALSSDDVGVILDLSKPFERNPFADFCERQQWAWQSMRNFGVAIKD